MGDNDLYYYRWIENIKNKIITLIHLTISVLIYSKFVK